MPEEALKHIAGFIEGQRSGAMCNVFGKIAEEWAWFQCSLCNRMKPCNGLRVEGRDDDKEQPDERPALRRTFERIDDECIEIFHSHRRVMSRWERVILQVCRLNGVNWN